MHDYLVEPRRITVFISSQKVYFFKSVANNWRPSPDLLMQVVFHNYRIFFHKILPDNFCG